MSDQQQLESMGFGADAVRTALTMNNGNLENALTMLLGQASHAEALSRPPAPAQPAVAAPRSCPTTTAATSRVPAAATATAAYDPQLEASAQALAGDRPCLDAVAALVDGLRADPRDPKAQVVQLAGKLAPLKRNPAGVTLLRSLGYAPRSGFEVLSPPADFAEKLAAAAAALARARGDERYVVAAVLAQSRAQALEDAARARTQVRAKPPRPEPPLRSLEGQPSTRLVFHFLENEQGAGGGGKERGGGVGRDDGAPPKGARVLERRFAPDDSLSDAVHFLGGLGDAESLPAHTWELVDGDPAAAPFWWCHGWELVDVTMRPARVLAKADATKTLQGLGLWPSAQITVRAMPLPDPTAPTTPTATGGGAAAASTRLGGTQYRPTPQEVMGSVAQRFAGTSELGGAASHHNVKGSAAHAHAEARAAAARAAEARAAAAKGAHKAPAHRQAAAAASPSAAFAPALSAPVSSASSAPRQGGLGAVEGLVGMGFGEAAARAALERAGGDPTRAVELLLS